MKLSIIAPCFNEVENIAKLHDELLPVVEEMVKQGGKNASEGIHSAEIIFVDDGSRDGTYARLQEVFNITKKFDIKFKFIKQLLWLLPRHQQKQHPHKQHRLQ
jgi:dolichol-phosphate mannosyltransferase